MPASSLRHTDDPSPPPLGAIGYVGQRINAAKPGALRNGVDVEGFDFLHHTTGVHWIDFTVGEVVSYVKAKKVYHDTLFVFTADHGVHGKMSCNDAGAHVPLIVHAPGKFTLSP